MRTLLAVSIGLCLLVAFLTNQFFDAKAEIAALKKISSELVVKLTVIKKQKAAIHSLYKKREVDSREANKALSVSIDQIRKVPHGDCLDKRLPASIADILRSSSPHIN
jgi:hypothetical protein